MTSAPTPAHARNLRCRRAFFMGDSSATPAPIRFMQHPGGRFSLMLPRLPPQSHEHHRLPCCAARASSRSSAPSPRVSPGDAVIRRPLPRSAAPLECATPDGNARFAGSGRKAPPGRLRGRQPAAGVVRPDWGRRRIRPRCRSDRPDAGPAPAPRPARWHDALPQRRSRPIRAPDGWCARRFPR